jgi:NADH-quinone oxidoreductase chain G
MTNMITVTINGKKVELERPVTILDAATAAGIKIPTLCHHKMLEPFGGCRLCLVEIEKMPRLQASCTQQITDGMVIWTETERVVEARKAMLEFILINHPLDCPYCDKAGECDLQDLTMKYGSTTGRFTEGKRTHPESYDDPIIVRNMERCISCTRCVRMCDKVQGASAISMVNRSSKTFVEPFSGGRYDCEYCGNCLIVCPVGAIMSRLHRHAYRPWMIEKKVKTVCSYCGVGCSMNVQVRENSIVRVWTVHGRGVNKGLMCGRGMFGYDYVKNQGRLKAPMVMEKGEFKEASWSEAFSFTAGRLKEIKDKHGSSSIAGIASGRYTNEDNYVLQKFLRVVLGSNNIDSAAGFAYAPAQRFFEKIFGQGVTANSIHGIPNSDGVFVIGSDPSYVNPVLGMQIRVAFQKGIPVVTVGYMPGLKRFATNSIIPQLFTETIFLSALIYGLMTKRPLSGANPAFEDIIKQAGHINGHINGHVNVDEAAAVCGITAAEINYAVNTLSVMTNPSIIIGRDIIQTSNGHINLLLLAMLTYLLNARIYLLSELPNEQGLVDMGCQPDMLPGGMPLTIESFRKRYEELLGVEVPAEPGMSLVEMIEGIYSGRIKALYVMGENPAFNMPDNNYVRNALSRLELLVVQDIFFTETASFAHVVLPSLAWAEKEGSFTNLERRMQRVKKAVEGEGMDDWKIIAEISRLLGFDMDYRNAKDIIAEISRVSPLHKDLSYDDMSDGECIWPYKGEPLRHDINIAAIKEIEVPDMKSVLKSYEGDYDYTYLGLGINKPLFHSDSLSRYSPSLNSISPESYVKISKAMEEGLV